jgi:RecA-family ATPase
MSRVEDIKGDDPVPFQIYTLKELDDLPKPEPLIGDVLTRGCVALLFGEYGTGKSFLALDWAAHLAAGRDWFSHEIYEEHRVLYVAAEGAGGLNLRRTAWEMEYGDIPEENFHVVRVAVRFGNDDEHYEHLEEMIRQNEYDFIVIDTLSRNTPGMDENGPDMSVFIERVFQLRDAHSMEKTAFLIVHHAGKDKSKGARGWSGLPAATDFSYRMSKGSDVLNVFTLQVDRTKDAEPIEEMSFTLKVHTVDEEWGRTSCTLTLDDYTPTQSEYMRSQAKPEPVDTPPWDEETGHVGKPKNRGRTTRRGRRR